jgi:threonine/homoserine/homoserine lactone efflux protein
MGVATADATYAAIAAFGLAAITELLVGIRQPLGIAGGAILVIMAARSLRVSLSGPVVVAQQEVRRVDGPLAAFATMLGLTLTNPATILSFAALFASIGAGTGGASGAALVVAGVFAGSVTWWAILTGPEAGHRAGQDGRRGGRPPGPPHAGHRPGVQRRVRRCDRCVRDRRDRAGSRRLTIRPGAESPTIDR